MRSSFLRLSSRVVAQSSFAPSHASLPASSRPHSDSRSSFYNPGRDTVLQNPTQEEERQHVARSESNISQPSTSATTRAKTEKKDVEHRSSPRPTHAAASTHASTSRLSSPFPPASSVLLSSISSSFPQSERSLYTLLRRISSVHPSVPASWYSQFHSHLAYSHLHLVSTRTYTFVIDLAISENNEALLERTLEEMRERRMRWDSDLGRILLKGYRKLGRADKVRDVLERLEGDRGGDGEREYVIEGRTTKRISLGSKGKGKARAEEQLLGGEGVGWKGWKTRKRDLGTIRKGQEETDQTERSKVRARPTASSPRTRTKKRPPASVSIPTVQPRRVLIPPEPHRLSSSSLSQLVQLLVQDRRDEEAFSLAEVWLSSNRPSLDNSTPSSSRPSLKSVHRYNSTLLVLLNILLKPLLLAQSRLSVVLAFPSEFISKHSPPLPLPQPLPGLSTIREILSGLVGRKNAWRLGKKVVDHFGYTWGLPIGDQGFEEQEEEPDQSGMDRLLFEAPTCARWRKYLELSTGPEEVDSRSQTKDREDVERLTIRPHRVVPPSVAVILLRHAVDTHSDTSTRFDAPDITSFRRWWRFVTSLESGSDWYEGSKVRELLIRAGEVGLLEKYDKARKRRMWLLETQRRFARQRRAARRGKTKGQEDKST